MDGQLIWAVVGLLLLVLFGLVLVYRRMTLENSTELAQFQQQVLANLDELLDAQAQQRFVSEELGKQLRLLNQDIEARQSKQSELLTQTFAQARTESQQAAHGLQQVIVGQFTQGNQIQSEKLNQFSETLHRTNTLIQDQLTQIRLSVEQKLKDIQDDNASKLELMRKTVDEKLHATLETRLGESFKQVSERLEQVYKGLGEMQTRATVRLPGKEDDQPVWLPIDSKFPKEQYERLQECFDRADADGVAVASKALEMAIRAEAKTIAEKYLAPPYTTDFGILFLPTEGLYAEVVKRPGLVDDLQRLHRVTVAGPITLTTLLNALQLGFKTLALEKRSSEVWTVLSAVKTEFGKFGDILAKTRDTLERAAKNIEQAETRSRVMQKKLKGVDELPEKDAIELLGLNDGKVDLLDDDDAPANA